MGESHPTPTGRSIASPVNTAGGGIRCLSCGYDIASLIEQRGRADPGVCPECGEGLADALRPRVGHAVQRRITPGNYLSFVIDAVLRPRQTCREVRLDRSGSGTWMLWNFAGGAAFSGVAVALTILFLGQDLFGAVGAGALVALVLAVWSAAMLLPLMLGLSLAASVFGWRFRGEGRWMALDIGSASWYSSCVCWPAALWLYSTFTVVAGTVGTILLFLPTALVFATTLRAMSLLKA